MRPTTHLLRTFHRSYLNLTGPSSDNRSITLCYRRTWVLLMRLILIIPVYSQTDGNYDVPVSNTGRIKSSNIIPTNTIKDTEDEVRGRVKRKNKTSNSKGMVFFYQNYRICVVKFIKVTKGGEGILKPFFTFR